MSYTDQEAKIVAAASPLTFEMAAEIAEKIGKTQRSVIAKAKSMGVEYIPKAKPLKKAKGVTKSDLVSVIAEKLGASADDFTGLDKANTAALQALIERIA